MSLFASIYSKDEDYDTQIGINCGVICILIRYLIRNDIDDKVLFNMKQEYRLKLVETIKTTETWKKEKQHMWFYWGEELELNVKTLNRYIYELREYKSQLQNILGYEQYLFLVFGYIRMILCIPSCITYKIFSFYYDNFQFAVTNYRNDEKECIIDPNNSRIAILTKSVGNPQRGYVVNAQQEQNYRFHNADSCITLDGALNTLSFRRCILQFTWFDTREDYDVFTGCTAIYFGYFWGNSISEIEHNRLNWDRSWNIPINGFQPLIYTEKILKRVLIWNEKQKKGMITDYWSIIPDRLTKPIWRIDINTANKNLQIRCKGIHIQTTTIKSAIYIQPVFVLVGDEDESIELIEAYVD